MEYAGPFAAALQRCFALLPLEILPGPQGLLDPGPRVSNQELRRRPGERPYQLHVLFRQSGAHLVGDFRQRPLPLVVALADQPLPEELLVEHLLVLAALEALFAPFRDPVPARVRGVDLIDDPELALAVDAELVLRIDQDEPALLRPALAGGEEIERHARHLVPLLLRD